MRDPDPWGMGEGLQAGSSSGDGYMVQSPHVEALNEIVEKNQAMHHSQNNVILVKKVVLDPCPPLPPSPPLPNTPSPRLTPCLRSRLTPYPSATNSPSRSKTRLSTLNICACWSAGKRRSTPGMSEIARGVGSATFGAESEKATKNKCRHGSGRDKGAELASE